MVDEHFRQQPALGAPAWWQAPGEDYWQAVLAQGEVVSEPVPPADPQEMLFPRPVAPEPDAPPPPLPGVPGEGLTGQEWDTARHALDSGECFTLRVVGANRGGVLVEWNGLEGFVPASHIRELPRARDAQDRVTELGRRIGDSLTVRLIEVDEPQSRLVFSERAATPAGDAPAVRLDSLRPGEVCRGRVLNLTSFGAFVDLGGIEGLIHISEISWDRLHHPSDALHSGMEVQVYVLGVNPDEGRVALSLKRLRPSPWAQVGSRYRVGQVVDGVVTSVVSFGAFVRVEEGLEGLVHASEFAEGAFVHPRNVVQEGAQVRVRVVHIDTDKQRLGLSLRRVSEVEQVG